MSEMKELHDVAVSYDEAFSSFQDMIDNAERQWAARVLAMYPNKADIEETAETLRRDLEADAVEVNALTAEVQETVAKVPTEMEKLTVPVEDSLCVIVVGADQPLQVSDIQRDQFVKDHAASLRGLKSWASVPIKIQGANGGTVCALEVQNARTWTEHDQSRLQKAADEISDLVTTWFHSVPKGSFL